MATHAHTTSSIGHVLLGLAVLGMGGLAGCGGARDHRAAPPALPLMATLHQVAAQGNPEAQAFLGFLYTKGQDVRQNDAEAVQWFQAAATQGDARAQFRLGDMYREGRGVPQNYLEAVQWWSQAAEQGYTLAQCALGDMYRLGQGVPQNFVHAYLWLNLCSAATKPGEFRTTSMQHRDEVARALTPEQLGQVQALASHWQPRPASASFGAHAGCADRLRRSKVVQPDDGRRLAVGTGPAASLLRALPPLRGGHRTLPSPPCGGALPLGYPVGTCAGASFPSCGTLPKG